MKGTCKWSASREHMKLTLKIRDVTHTIKLIQGMIGYDHVSGCGSLVRNWNIRCTIDRETVKLYFIESA